MTAPWLSILVSNNQLSSRQVADCERTSRAQSMRLEDTLIANGVCTLRDISVAKAEAYGLEFIELSTTEVPPRIVELIPESVARENAILPLAEQGDSLIVATSEPDDLDTVKKLRFILNRVDAKSVCLQAAVDVDSVLLTVVDPLNELNPQLIERENLKAGESIELSAFSSVGGFYIKQNVAIALLY